MDMEPGEAYWKAIDTIWDEINIDSVESFQRTFQNVPSELGLVYAAHFCQSEVCNGGFTQFFWNSTGVLAPEAVEGFVAIGQVKVADVVRRAMSMLGAPYLRDRAARWLTLDGLAPATDQEPGSAGHAGYRNIDLFGPLEKDFYSLLRTDGGGFENAADEYLVALGHENASPASAESEKDAIRKTLRGLSKADAKEFKNQFLEFKTDLARTRRRLVEKTGD
jgi:hypothetical protein